MLIADAILHAFKACHAPKKTGADISSRFHGPATLRDPVTGTYEEVLPELTADAETLQRALIKGTLPTRRGKPYEVKFK